jgi:hypothetical protein
MKYTSPSFKCQVSSVPSGSITVIRAEPVWTYPSRIPSSRIRSAYIDQSSSADQNCRRARRPEPTAIPTGGLCASTAFSSTISPSVSEVAWVVIVAER